MQFKSGLIAFISLALLVEAIPTPLDMDKRGSSKVRNSLCMTPWIKL
jgi:hypothetical protein